MDVRFTGHDFLQVVFICSRTRTNYKGNTMTFQYDDFTSLEAEVKGHIYSQTSFLSHLDFIREIYRSFSMMTLHDLKADIRGQITLR